MAKIELTEAEKREILQCLEEGKPLEDRYRFLLFGDKKEVELVWNGKSNEVCNVVLPFQTIEQIDEPRDEKKAGEGMQGLLFDNRGRQLKGWSNKLIWGDNKLILSSLKNGPLREEIEKQGGLKLIYIDPPFDVGADFTMDIEIGDDTFTKEPNILEEIAYRDTWGKGADSFISMIYERLILMKDLLADDGSIYVHCDWRVNSYIRAILNEIFSKNSYKNTIIWQKIRVVKAQSNKFGNVHDYIFFYAKDNNIFNQITRTQEVDYDKKFDKLEATTGRKYQLVSLVQKGKGPARHFGNRILEPPAGMHWIWSQERIDQAMKDEIIEFTKTGNPRKKQYLDNSSEKFIDDLWNDVFPVNSQALESVSYPTQKPEALLERIIKASSNEGDLVADFFSGSGTTLAVAEKLGRKWIGSDLGKFAIHTTRKRMISVQRELKSSGSDYRAFEVLNLGKYERQHYIGVNMNLRQEEQQRQLQEKEQAFTDLILNAYKAQRVENFNCFLGKKAGRFVAVGPVNLPVTRLFVEEIILECRQKHITRVDILGFEFEMGLFPSIQEEAKAKGIDLALKHIPPEVFDKRAIEKDEVVFHDVAFIEVTPRYNGDRICVELTDFSVFYSQDSVKKAEMSLRNGGSKVVVEKGKIVKVSKSKIGEVKKEVLTKKWTDWVDYWAVDFDFESRREIVRIKDADTGEIKEQWTGDYVFENEWQSFRTKKNREIELISAERKYEKGKRYKIAITVVDIFGNDTMKVIDVGV